MPAHLPILRRRFGRLMLAGLALIATAACSATPPDQQDPPRPLPLRPVGEIGLPGDTSRFDYASLDTQRGLLFVAHLGAGEAVEIDTTTQKVVRTLPDLAQVHGILVVGARGRVYATATGTNQLVAIDEASGAELGRAPTGKYPDGLAYDPRRGAIWTTNETAGTETIVDAASMQPLGSVDLGGQVGNVGYDQPSDRMLVPVQGRNDLAVIDPAATAAVQRVALPGCDYPHGLSIDEQDRLVFVACQRNATLLTVDANTWHILATNPIGEDPDVLAYDTNAHRLYVAAETGPLTVLDVHNRTPTVIGSGHMADDAHVVAVDPITHRSYYPIANGPGGHPVLLEREPN
jgi:DNA-binding beta-propeller fold protein YncE